MEELFGALQHQVNVERIVALLGVQSEARLPEYDEMLAFAAALEAPAARCLGEVHRRELLGLVDDTPRILKRVVVVSIGLYDACLVLIRLSQLGFVIEVERRALDDNGVVLAHHFLGVCLETVCTMKPQRVLRLSSTGHDRG